MSGPIWNGDTRPVRAHTNRDIARMQRRSRRAGRIVAAVFAVLLVAAVALGAYLAGVNG